MAVVALDDFDVADAELGELDAVDQFDAGRDAVEPDTGDGVFGGAAGGAGAVRQFAPTFFGFGECCGAGFVALGVDVDADGVGGLA